MNLEPSRGDRNCTLQRTSAEQAEALMLFVASADARDENKTFDAGVAWFDRGYWRTRATLLGRYLTTIDAKLFAISSAAREAGLILRKQEVRHVDIVSASRGALAAVNGATL